MNVTIWWLVAISLVAAGIAGTILPVLPGALLVFGGLLLGAWIDGFTTVGWIPLGGIALLALLGWAADYAAAALGAKKAGASGLTVVGAAIGTLVGIAGGFIGVLVFPFLGAVLGEWITRTFHRPQSQTLAMQGALKVGVATWIALVVVIAFKLAAAFAMIGIFVIAYFW